jgi:DNA-binding transcriptional LysR family regulator
MEAAEQGLGLALSPASVVRQRIERGVLKAVPGVSFDNGWGYWLLTRPLGPLRRPVEEVAAWLEEAVLAARTRQSTSRPRRSAPL